jgi:HD superfamily phosphodiesterase
MIAACIESMYKNAKMTSKQEESADLDIVLAAALLHDLIVYPKGSIKTINSADDSAEITTKILLEHNTTPYKILLTLHVCPQLATKPSTMAIEKGKFDCICKRNLTLLYK